MEQSAHHRDAPMISAGNWVLLPVAGVQQLLGKNNPILLIQRAFQILRAGSCGEMRQKISLENPVFKSVIQIISFIQQIIPI